MNINKNELDYEKKKLIYVSEKIREELSSLGQNIMGSEEKRQEFGKYLWDEQASFDPAEMQSLLTNDALEGFFLIQKQKYFSKLYNIQKSPYFASIIFKEENGEEHDIYISMTYLTKEDENILYDWRSPICNIFYDYEPGRCEYNTPDGLIKGELKRKRQYKIINGKLIRLFDNSINIDDDVLQEVLAQESSDKMKNIVNTIQTEQNSIIRNLFDKNLIVQGIAGSGKTSVALHRIAFLLYRMENLSSKNVLIFSPNEIFTEYISNILPELGEENTLQTTFQDYLSTMITEYKKIESFPDFISRYYKVSKELNQITKYKQSDEIIKDLEDFVKAYVKSCRFTSSLYSNGIEEISKEELNDMFHDRYSKFPVFERVPAMASKLSEVNYNGSKKYAKSYQRRINEVANFKKDYKKIYKGFYLSKFSRIKLTEEEITKFINRKELYYDDALLLVYLKGLLEGFSYEASIKQVVIDEAQDYNKLQYLIISKIFKKSGFTILGDINQTVNPYYKYSSWNEIIKIFGGKYIELNKSYRSSSAIVEYTNKILGINNVCAIRKGKEKPVLYKEFNNDIFINIEKDLNYLLKEYKSTAIITKDEIDSEEIYEKLKDKYDIKYLSTKEKSFTKKAVIIPAYMAKGLEFDSVIVINNPKRPFTEEDKNLLYVAATRAQHELIIYN